MSPTPDDDDDLDLLEDELPDDTPEPTSTEPTSTEPSDNTPTAATWLSERGYSKRDIAEILIGISDVNMYDAEPAPAAVDDYTFEPEFSIEQLTSAEFARLVEGINGNDPHGLSDLTRAYPGLRAILP